MKILIILALLLTASLAEARCYSNMDCPVGTACQGRIGSSQRVCVPITVVESSDSSQSFGDSTKQCRSNLDCPYGKTCNAAFLQVGTCN